MIEGWWLVVALARVAPALAIALAGARLGVGRVATVAIAVVIGLAFAVFGAPLLEPAVTAVAEGSLGARVAILGREVAIGAALGVTAIVPIAAAQAAGAWIAAAGDGETVTWSTATTLLAATVCFALGGHLALIEAIGATYRALPPAGAGAAPDLGATAIAAGTTLFGAAAALAAPMLGAAVVSALVLGGVERGAQLAAGALPVEALRGVAASLALAAMVFAMAYGVAAWTRGLPAALAAATGG